MNLDLRDIMLVKIGEVAKGIGSDAVVIVHLILLLLLLRRLGHDD